MSSCPRLLTLSALTLLASVMASCNEPTTPSVVELQATASDETLVAAFRCGPSSLTARFRGDIAWIEIDEHRLELQRAISASGARYTDANDADTEFWTKGDRAMLKIAGKAYPECIEGQSDADTSLLGHEWIVEDIASGGIIDNSRASLIFGPDGTLSGRASCNSYSGLYALSGERITVSRLAGTMMACAPALMEQEDRFFDILKQADRIEFTDDGALVVVGADGRRLLARHD